LNSEEAPQKGASFLYTFLVSFPYPNNQWEERYNFECGVIRIKSKTMWNLEIAWRKLTSTLIPIF